MPLTDITQGLLGTAMIASAITAAVFAYQGCNRSEAEELGITVCPNGIYLANGHWDPQSDYFEVRDVGIDINGNPVEQGTYQFPKDNVLVGLDLERCEFRSAEDMYEGHLTPFVLQAQPDGSLQKITRP